MVAPRQPPLLRLVEELLAEQGRLQTPAARTAALHNGGSGSALSGLSSQLIPLSAPGPGEHYAFEVDLDACSGCKACVAACHSLNGLEDTESWREVGLLVGGTVARPFQQTVTSACHHCADPACLNGCPVLAYEKDPITGIVRHLDDQCIGCQYCVLKCPYDVPKYSERLGIVRKCDMCHSRLTAGEAPACVQACPTSAIRIVTITTTRTDGAIQADTSSFLPQAPDAGYTQPTTRYLSKRPRPKNLVAADATTLRPQPPHWPLVAMLTLLTTAVACQIVAVVWGAEGSNFSAVRFRLGWWCGAAGLIASVFHLGQPRRAWRIFLGWKKSWLSREALLFGAWFAVSTLTFWLPRLGPTAAGIGLLGLFCSVMIYVDTRRNFWRWTQTLPRFFGTLSLLVLATSVPRAAALLLFLKLAWETRTFWDGSISARLQRRPLRGAVTVRDILGLGAGILLLTFPGILAIGVLLAGEIAERSLFFRAVDAPKMPGIAP